MPLTTRGLKYTYFKTFDALYSATDLKLRFTNQPAIDEIDDLFLVLQTIPVLNSLEFTYVYNGQDGAEIDTEVIERLATLLTIHGKNLRHFKLRLDVAFEDDDLYEETLLQHLESLITSATALTQLKECSLAIKSRKEIGSYAIFGSMISFLCQIPLPQQLIRLGLNFDHINTTGDDEQSDGHAQLNDFIKKCTQLNHAQMNFSEWSFGLYTTILLLKNLNLKTADVQLDGSFLENISEPGSIESRLLDNQIAYLAKMIRMNPSLTKLKLDINLEKWLVKNPARPVMLQNMLQYVAQNRSIRQLSVNFGGNFKFAPGATQSVIESFHTNFQLANLKLANLSRVSQKETHTITQRNNLGMRGLLNAHFNSTDLAKELFAQENIAIYYIGNGSLRDCKIGDILMYFYFANLSSEKVRKSGFYYPFILAAAVTQAVPTLQKLPHTLQEEIAKYLDKSTLGERLTVSGGFFTQVKNNLTMLRADYEKRFTPSPFNSRCCSG